MPGRLAVVTSSRADYCHLHWPLRELFDEDAFDVQLIVTGAHLSPAFGESVRVIEADEFPIAAKIECLEPSDKKPAMARAIGRATLGFADAFEKLDPDLLLLIADRYEMLAPANAALAMNIPIAHIEGGELSEGAIDNQVRNALTMMSHLHLTTTKRAAQRIIDMGEEPWRVHHVGAASLDHLHRSNLFSRKEIETKLDLSLDPAPTIVTVHPVTLEDDPIRDARIVLDTLQPIDHPLIFCYPNADAGAQEIIEMTRAFCTLHDRARLFINLSPIEFWSLLRHAHLLLGNSSSGIMEAPALGIPSIDIGSRQQGRERAASVLHAPPDHEAILRAIERADDESFRASTASVENPYGDGRASQRITAVLRDAPPTSKLLIKRRPWKPVA